MDLYLFISEVIAEYSTNDDGVIGHSTTVKLSSEDKRKQKFGALDFSTEVDCDYDCQMEIQKYRKKTITEQCAALGMASNHHNTTLNPKVIRKLEHFLVLDKYKIIYCYIPKAGCTNWKRVLLVLSGKANSTQSIGQKETHVLTSKYIRSLSTYTISEAKYRLENYVKFTFVRNPFVRLLSAYRDKLEKRTSLNGVFRKDWSKKMKKLTEAFKRYRLRGMDLNTTFHEYVEYVSDPQNNLLDPAEEHWIEMFRLSHPCAINFDFIGRVETLDRDTNFVLRNIIGISPKKILFRNSTNPTNSSDGRLLQKYFSDVPRKDVRALYQRFAPDFKLFGYEDPISLLEED
ncbi:putative carbohydrate sulfotransferase 11 isoform X2 [Apostichopus japonicus]|uniref:Carbohydrate sulfotransferase n=1 Tax=Stichopus japonicus TaxID=307972 RepID=A0A2G8LC38_STIJA|nr:putative carbohydrate sulfotransferase 11 isoform X2 [Apostichopus japonicus]